MYKFYKIIFPLISISFLLPHGVSKSTANAMTDATLTDFIYFGAKHMVTGYDHILFLFGVLFFLTKYSDIFKFITAFTIAHCITLIFATFFEITANAYLIDAVIAFSVIYKGFENLGGFKKWLPISAPNLLLMVFIFGLIHGFGLSTKLQEVTTNLSLSRILSFNVGVELGQIAWLLIIFPFLQAIKGNYNELLSTIFNWILKNIFSGKYFNIISKVSNWILVILGIYLLYFQLNGYFTDHHHKPNEINQNINTVEILVQSSNEILFDGKLIDIQQIAINAKNKIQEFQIINPGLEKNKNPKQPTFTIKVDEKAKYQIFLDVLDQLKMAGCRKINVLGRDEDTDDKYNHGNGHYHDRHHHDGHDHPH